MVYLGFTRSSSLSPDYRPSLSISSPSSWQYNNDAGGYRIGISQSRQRDGSRSPRRSSSISRYGSERNSSFDQNSLNYSYSVPLSRSRDRSRRLSVADLYSTSSNLPSKTYTRSTDYLTSPFSSTGYYRRPYAQNFNAKKSYTSTSDLLRRYTTPLSTYSDPPLSSHSTRTSASRFTSSMPYSIYDLYEKPYRYIGNNIADTYTSDARRRSYTSKYNSSITPPMRREQSTPTYFRYNSSSLAHTPSNYSSGYRPSSLSRYSTPRFTSSEPSWNAHSIGVETSEPIQSRLLNILNKYSDRIYKTRSLKDILNYPGYKWLDESRYKDDTSTDSPSHTTTYYDSLGSDKYRGLNDIKERLTYTKDDKEWISQAKNNYSRQQRRLSAILTNAYNADKSDTLNVPDNLEATFTSLSRKSTPRASIAKPEIKIEGINLENNPNVYQELVNSNLESLLGEKEKVDISNRDLAKLLKTDNSEDLTKLVLDAGENFRPDEISTTVLPTGEKALVMTQTKQTAVSDDGVYRKSISPAFMPSPLASEHFLSPTFEPGTPASYQEQEWANEEIEKFTQLTDEFEENLQTLEHFIAKNRCLFPENLIIYQRIVYYKSSTGDIIKQGLPAAKRLSIVGDSDVCAVKVREKLVLPHGCRKNGYDVVDLLKRCYHRYEEVEVVYDDEENIKENLLRQEHGKLNPFDDDFDKSVKPSKKTLNIDNASDADSGRNSPVYIDEDELLQRCRRDDECLPCFVTMPKSQIAMPGQSVRFTCSVSGNPEPEVYWYKDGLPLLKDGRFLATNNYGVCSLKISSSRPEDKGVYKIEVENSIGTVSTEVGLEVLSTGTPQSRSVSDLAFIRTPPYYVHMTEGDPLTLRCNLQGSKRPKVTWYKGLKELFNGEKYRVVAENKWQYVMQITNLELSDGALYSVVANDGLTSVKHSVEVNVVPKKPTRDDTITEYEIVKKMGHIKLPPMFVKGLPLQHEMKEGSNLLIGCEIDESDPHPYVVGVEIVEKKRKRSESKEKKTSYLDECHPFGAQNPQPVDLEDDTQKESESKEPTDDFDSPIER